jgi:hypothetical protein
MGRSIAFSVFVGLLLVALLAGVGYLAYQTGFAQGVAASGTAGIPAAYVQPAVVATAPFLYPPVPWAYGFGWLGCLVPFLLVLAFFGLMRLTFGFGRHGGWRRGGYGPGMRGMPPFVEDWHRRAHGQDSEPKEQGSASV